MYKWEITRKLKWDQSQKLLEAGLKSDDQVDWQKLILVFVIVTEYLTDYLETIRVVTAT